MSTRAPGKQNMACGQRRQRERVGTCSSCCPMERMQRPAETVGRAQCTRRCIAGGSTSQSTLLLNVRSNVPATPTSPLARMHLLKHAAAHQSRRRPVSSLSSCRRSCATACHAERRQQQRAAQPAAAWDRGAGVGAGEATLVAGGSISHRQVAKEVEVEWSGR